MGCNTSQERDSSSMRSGKLSRRPATSSTTTESSPLMPPGAAAAMGNPIGPSTSNLASQHERLILELLPFKESRNFQEWLQSSYVRGSWHEYCRDFLAANPTSPEVDKAKTSQAAKDAINSRNPRYLLYHPDKDGWTPEDHVVRFIVAVVADNMLKSIWSDHDWKKRNIEVCKAVYEVLSFLRGTDFGAPMPPRYEASLIH